MRELTSYVIFGVLTTAVNFVTYLIADSIFINTVASTIIAWVVAVTFAFVTNKLFVFKSKSTSRRTILKEALSFFSFRLLSGFLDLAIMVLGVDVFLFDKLIVKTASNVIIVITNYLVSKLLVFKKTHPGVN